MFLQQIICYKNISVSGVVLSEAVGSGDDDDGVAAEEDCAAAKVGHVSVEEGALPGELILLGDHASQDPLVTLATTSRGILHPGTSGRQSGGLSGLIHWTTSSSCDEASNKTEEKSWRLLFC